MSLKYTDSEEWILYKALMDERPQLFRQSPLIKIVSDEDTVNQFVEETKRKVGVIHRSEFNIFVIDLVKNEDGSLYTYERLIPTANENAVVAVPLYDGKFVLLKQFRHSFRGEQYAFPRGFGENNLPPEEDVKKEVKEELSADAHDIDYLGELYADSGLISSLIKAYSCRISEFSLKSDYEGIEDIITLSKAEMDDFIRNGKINDGITLAAYSLYTAKNR